MGVHNEGMQPRLAALALLFLAGCTAPRPPGRAPALEPPPLRSSAPLSREDVLRLVAEAEDPERAIQTLDERRFEFALDAATVEWFKNQGIPPEVLDYLRKRARIDWEGLRGDVDPDSPEVGEYVDPRRGFEDFGGSHRREQFTSLRSRDPFTARRATAWERALAGGQ